MEQDKRADGEPAPLGDLTAAFPATSLETWTQVVEKALKGGTVADRLTTRTLDGLAIKPLYTKADWAAGRSGVPGAVPYTRGAQAEAELSGGWDLRQVIDDPRLDLARAAIAEDLEGGATSLGLRIAEEPPSQCHGPWGLWVATLAELDQVLKDVDLRGAGIALEVGQGAFAAGAALLALAEQRGVPGGELRGALNVDPIGTFAASGHLRQSLPRVFDDLADLVRVVAARTPNLGAVGVDARLYHTAGASEAQEVAFALATGAAYLRALDERGIAPETALHHMTFSFAVDSQFFRSMAKLRAARLAWARVADAVGAGSAAGAMRIWAEGAWRDLATRDAYVNMLRGTAHCFAAACGNADAISVRPFDEALAVPGLFGRRIARNTQLILAEESGLGRVRDPAGGAWSIETLTEEFAAKAWSLFQEIEAQGGMVKAIEDGRVEHAIAGIRKTRTQRLATRKDPVTGVSIFPDLNEPMVSRAEIDWTALATETIKRRRAARVKDADAKLHALARAPAQGRVAAAIEALKAGATFAEIDSAGAEDQGQGLPKAVALRPMRQSAAFERLRDASDSLPRRPRVFLANFGKPRDYLDRATFARNVFAVGGIEPVGDGGCQTVDELVAAAKASGASLIVLSCSDEHYQQHGVDCLKALKALSPTCLYAVAQPDDALTAAGVDAYVRRGIDIGALLADALTKLGARVS